MDSGNVKKSSKGIGYASGTKVQKEEETELVKAGTKRGVPIAKYVERAASAKLPDDGPKEKKIRRSN
ncbi:hypothetical protein BOTNAR_0365g00110 [Botryotinia narcissicola]|uniref:Uncharacterized protein n=1 Tax=Botryotinia narcissicola TaxID=278944 RepID=A0A4Z1HQS5_9HELO|nr:hypothetical protein BOTNAR_0365g00110 [Botryotinia narcissicola]